MSKKTNQLLIAIAVVIGVCLFVFLILELRPFQESEEEDSTAPEIVIDKVHLQEAVAQHEQTPIEDDPRITRQPDGRVFYNVALDDSRQLRQSEEPLDDIIIIEQLLGHYRYVYKENPVGENFEIVEQLMGNNSMKIVFIAPESEALLEGNLVDRWDTPYFFHALSGQDMTVRSAGPDKKMWTDDDVTVQKG